MHTRLSGCCCIYRLLLQKLLSSLSILGLEGVDHGAIGKTVVGLPHIAAPSNVIVGIVLDQKHSSIAWACSWHSELLQRVVQFCLVAAGEKHPLFRGGAPIDCLGRDR